MHDKSTRTPLLAVSVTRETGHTHNNTTRTTQQTTTRTNPPPHTQQRSKVARRRCVPPPPVGGRAEVSMGGRIEVRRALGPARVQHYGRTCQME